MKEEFSPPKERLLQAAIHLFAEKGYAATSVNEIVKATGLAKPALYYYFKNKEELYFAILSYGFDERLQMMKEAFEQHSGWKNQLIALVRSVLKFSKEKYALCRVTFQASFAPANEVPAHLPLQKMGTRNIKFMSNFFRRGIQTGFFRKGSDPRALSLAFNGHLLYYLLLQSLNPSLLPKKTSAEKIVELFLNGATKRN